MYVVLIVGGWHLVSSFCCGFTVILSKFNSKFNTPLWIYIFFLSSRIKKTNGFSILTPQLWYI